MPLTGHDPSGGSQQLGEKGTATITQRYSQNTPLSPSRSPSSYPHTSLPVPKSAGTRPAAPDWCTFFASPIYPPTSIVSSSLFHLLTHTCIATSTYYPLGPVPVTQSSIMVSASAQPALQERHTHTHPQTELALSSHPGPRRGERENHARQHRPRPLFFLRGVRYARIVVTPPSAHRRPGYDALTLLRLQAAFLFAEPISDVSNHLEGVLLVGYNETAHRFSGLMSQATPFFSGYFQKQHSMGRLNGRGSPPRRKTTPIASPPGRRPRILDNSRRGSLENRSAC